MIPDFVSNMVYELVLKWARKLGGLVVKSVLDQKQTTIEKTVKKTEAERLRKILSDHADPNDGLTDQGLVDVAMWARANLSLRQCYDILFGQSPTFSLLDRYAVALNEVIDQMKKIDRPLAVQGFLHSTECLTFFDPDRPVSNRGDVRRYGEKLIFPKQDVDIYILDGPTTDERLSSFNSAIVTAENNRLPAADYKDSCRVVEVDQSRVHLKPQLDYFGQVADDDKPITASLSVTPLA